MRHLKLIIILAAVALTSSACTLSIGANKAASGSNPNTDGGVWLSTDKGSTWKQAVLIPTVTGQPRSLGNVDTNVLTADPQDSAAVYLGTVGKGLYYTYNINNGWNEVKSLGQGTINDVKVDPKNKCTLYAAITNHLYRSVDCGRSWQQAYYDNNTGVGVTAIAVDHYDDDNIYIGTSRGDIIKSIDHGDSWRTIKRINENIARLIISPQDSRLVYVATIKNHIYSFSSNTVTNPNTSADIDQNFAVTNWQDLSTVLKDFNLGSNFRDLAICAADGSLFLTTEQAIVRSPDKGATWEKINLLPPEKDAIINAIAVNPKDSQEIYYVTNTALFNSSDGGVTWTMKKLNTSRAGWDLLIDMNNPNNIYLGTKKLQ